MPQTDLFWCERDLLEVGQALFDEGGIIIPDLDYSSAELLRISDTGELRRVYNENNLNFFFVVSPKWQRAPLTIREIQKNGRAVFFVSQKNGGPSLDLFIPRPSLVNGRYAVPHGFLSYHSSFWNPISEQMEAAPQVLKETYRNVRSKLVHGGIKLVRKPRCYIITKNTQLSDLELIDLKRDTSEEARFISAIERRGVVPES